MQATKPAFSSASRQIEYLVGSVASAEKVAGLADDAIAFTQSISVRDNETADSVSDTDSGSCRADKALGASNVAQSSCFVRRTHTVGQLGVPGSLETTIENLPWPQAAVVARPYQCTVYRTRGDDDQPLEFEESYSEKASLALFVNGDPASLYRVRVALDVYGVSPNLASMFRKSGEQPRQPLTPLMSEDWSSQLSPSSVTLLGMSPVDGVSGVWEGVFQGATFYPISLSSSYRGRLQRAARKTVGSFDCIRYRVNAVSLEEALPHDK